MLENNSIVLALVLLATHLLWNDFAGTPGPKVQGAHSEFGRQTRGVSAASRQDFGRIFFFLGVSQFHTSWIGGLGLPVTSHTPLVAPGSGVSTRDPLRSAPELPLSHHLDALKEDLLVRDCCPS